MAVKRFDAGRLDKAERTPQGGLRVPSFPTRVGVLVYRNPDGTQRRELRPPEEVFASQSLASMRAAPVTDLHPEHNVTPENWRTLTVGHVGEDVKQDGEHVSAPLLIQDANMIRMIESGERKECSCGYSCDLDLTPGVWGGQPYDGVQRNITYNHVALGPPDWGRAGSTVALRLDSGDAEQVRPENSLPLKKPAERKPMKTVRIDGIDYEIGTDAHLQAVARRDSAQQAKIADLETANAALTKDRDDHKKRADSVETANKDLTAKLKAAEDPKTIHEKAAARADMLDKVRRAHKAAGVRFDETAAAGNTAEELLRAAIVAMDPSMDLKDATPDMIAGIFKALFSVKVASAAGAGGTDTEEPLSEGEPPPPPQGGNGAPPAPPRQDGRRSIYDARQGAGGGRQDGKQADPSDVDAAYDRMRKDNEDRARRPLGPNARRD